MTLESYVSKYHAQYHLLLKLFRVSMLTSIYLFQATKRSYVILHCNIMIMNVITFILMNVILHSNVILKP